MFKFLRELFSKKPTHSDKVWVGVAEARYVNEEKEVTGKCYYHLYVKFPLQEGHKEKRIVEFVGYNAENHSFYHNRIKPWKEGFDKSILDGYLEQLNKEYWGDNCSAAIPSKAPIPTKPSSNNIPHAVKKDNIYYLELKDKT